MVNTDKDEWDDLNDNIDLTGSFETFINVQAIRALVSVLKDCLDALEVSAPQESPYQQRYKYHQKAIRDAKAVLQMEEA